MSGCVNRTLSKSRLSDSLLSDESLRQQQQREGQSTPTVVPDSRYRSTGLRYHSVSAAMQLSSALCVGLRTVGKLLVDTAAAVCSINQRSWTQAADGAHSHCSAPSWRLSLYYTPVMPSPSLRFCLMYCLSPSRNVFNPVTCNTVTAVRLYRHGSCVGACRRLESRCMVPQRWLFIRSKNY